jgi:hypothetical protein
MREWMFLGIDTDISLSLLSRIYLNKKQYSQPLRTTPLALFPSKPSMRMPLAFVMQSSCRLPAVLCCLRIFAPTQSLLAK